MNLTYTKYQHLGLKSKLVLRQSSSASFKAVRKSEIINDETYLHQSYPLTMYHY